MKWKSDYQRKLVSAAEAVNSVKSGNRVVLAHACGESPTLSSALVSRAPELTNVEIVHMVPMGKAHYCAEGMSGSFLHNSLFAGTTTREHINAGRADYTPCFFSEVPQLFRSGHLPVDVAMVQLSPPDEHGFLSFGVSVDYTKPAASCAKLVIAAVNRNMPRTLGDSFIHVRDIHYIVETSDPIMELPTPKITAIEEAIGENVSLLVEDGSTLQVGIGALPEAVLRALRGKTDLGIHTEMFSDGVLELVEEGVVTNKAKNYHVGKMICSFLMGTRKLYDFVHNNPMVEMHPVDYTNDPFVIARNDRMVSINSALQIDVTGQVCADTIGYRQFSGVGGQVDFVRGASRSRGGKSVIALPSTAAGGRISRIVVKLDEGAAVTTSRNDVHLVVTEYGTVDLRGKTLRDRAQALISIAHPDFRTELARDLAKARGAV